MDNEGISPWKSLSRAATVAAIVGGLAGGLVTYLTRSRATEVRLLELGVQILQENPEGQNRALREWGLALLERNSEADLPPGLRDLLRDSVSFPGDPGTLSQGTSLDTLSVRASVDPGGEALEPRFEAHGPISIDQQGTIVAEGAGRGTVIVRLGEDADTSFIDIMPPDSTDRDSIG